MTRHEEKVAKAVTTIKSINGNGQALHFKKDSISHMVPNPYAKNKKGTKVDFSPFNELIEIDAENMTATAEPGLTFLDLLDKTLPLGLMPYVVPELKTITIGGAVSGCSIESQSYKVGGFHDNCLEYEVISGTGEVLTCSPEKDAEIFNMLHGSYGTLGRISKLKFKLRPTKPYMKMEYRHFDNFETYWSELKTLCKSEEDLFIDGIVHSPDHMVMCIGQLVDEAPYTSSYEWLNIYYKSTITKQEDYLTIKEYLFRYDAECHWLTRTVPLMETKPVRFAIGKLVLGSSKMISWSNRLKSILKLKKRPEVVVDVFIPAFRFDEFYSWYEKKFEFFPLWLVPYKMKEIYPWVDDEYAKKMGDGFLIDAAVYGKLNNDPNVDYSELLENKVTDVNGVKTLISRNHYSREDFWKIFNKPRIESAKKRLDPNNLFGDLYEKFAPHNYS